MTPAASTHTAAHLITSAPQISEPPRFWPTGNLWVSLPEIGLDDGAVRSLGVLLERANGLVQVVGGPDGLLRPRLAIDGATIHLAPRWQRIGDWVPHQRSTWAGGEADVWYCAPVGERGAAFRLRYRNLGTAPAQADLSWTGAWASSTVSHLRAKPLDGKLTVHDDPWTGSRVAALSIGLPLLALALQGGNGVALGNPPQAGSAWLAGRTAKVSPGGELTADVYLAVAPEPDGAAVTALHLRRRGFDALLRATLDWLSGHALPVPADALPGLAERINANLFFNYFFAQGDCLDTGTPAMVTSRSPHYYVCAAFWSRDAYCWTFPALLLTDTERARQVLVASLGAAGPRVADHALYLNGTPLYPGFELDQAAAPVLAIWRYVQATEDRGVLAEPAVARAVSQLPALVAPWQHPDWDLYGTFLLPTDDPTDYPYVTACNALLAAALDAAADLAEISPADLGLRSGELRERASAVRRELRARLVTGGPHGRMWAWACDADGKHEIRDEPPLGLRTLPFWGLTHDDNAVQAATRAWLTAGYSYYQPGPFGGAGAPHFPFPSGFDLANRLLDGDDSPGGALDALARTPMDQGLACESWDAQTGRVRTGAAMASMAGLLAWTAWARLTGQRRFDQAPSPGDVRPPRLPW
jgi:uncharacterized protein